MKTKLLPIIAVVLIISMLLVAAPGTVSAKANQPNGVANGDWNTGSVAVVDLMKTTYPSWLQLMDENGSTLTGPGTLCHPFRGGTFGWTADIRELVNGSWVQIPTTMQWMPDKDGVYTACAQAPSAGEYALFGYYDESKAPKTSDAVCQYEDWVAYFWYHDDTYEWEPGYSLEVHLASDPTGFPTGKEVKYTIMGTYPIAGLSDLPQTGSTESWDDGEIYATFTDYVYTGDFNDIPDFTNSIKVETGGCTYILPITNITYCDVFGCG